MTEKRQTSQGYIIRILPHFATKLWNITNFVMLFQAVMKPFCLDLFTSKFLSIMQMVHCVAFFARACSDKFPACLAAIEILTILRPCSDATKHGPERSARFFLPIGSPSSRTARRGRGCNRP